MYYLTLLFMTCPHDSSHGKSQVPFLQPTLVTINYQDASNILAKIFGVSLSRLGIL